MLLKNKYYKQMWTISSAFLNVYIFKLAKNLFL